MLRNALGHVRRTARPVAQPIKKWKIVRGDLVRRSHAPRTTENRTPEQRWNFAALYDGAPPLPPT